MRAGRISLTGPTRCGDLGNWVVTALSALPPKPEIPAHDMLERLARQVAVLPAILARRSDAE